MRVDGVKSAFRGACKGFARAWELLKQIEPGKGGRLPETSVDAHTSFTRKDAARQAGMSERQQVTAIRESA